jgi:hypothetical protein
MAPGCVGWTHPGLGKNCEALTLCDSITKGGKRKENSMNITSTTFEDLSKRIDVACTTREFDEIDRELSNIQQELKGMTETYQAFSNEMHRALENAAVRFMKRMLS